MHIPDGYLSPATCVATYAIVLPFWVVAFRRVQRQLHTRLVPLLALFSAFSFVIMMFNLPLPGGTTGHAVGVALAAIVLGPWAAIVAISMALLIQALFFGDGGLTTYAANCLNMAVVGAFVAHWTYALIGGRSAPASPRRVVAAAVAGYLALNVAALATAIEFGVQPMFFHDADGTPLYAPYPLSIALPAMMIGHLGVAGIAELAVSAGVVAYLQRSASELLTWRASRCAADTPRSAWRSTRALWVALAALVVATPVGLVASGTAWGEWSVEDFVDAQARLEIAQASSDVAPPPVVPGGLERLAALWQAPLPDYVPAFIADESLGYIASALIGCALIVLGCVVVARLAGRRQSASS
jgi:cobalt/nickel transport system permease protein